MPTFVDQIKIEVHAGHGGNGMVAFRREKYVPNGGPAGGDGGRGGSIILKVDEGLRTLMDFRYHRIFKAKNGQNGMSKQMTGAAADDTVIAVPQGTTVRDLDTGQIVGDLVEQGQELVVAKGGRGGRGNIHFASPKNPAPEIAENGEPGEDHYLELELKMLADVGLIGFPSVGKSTLLSVVTGAKPKIAAYEFTTLVPNLGMVMLPDGRDFAMADMPGLINGASKGVGLGLQFLRHIERTRVLGVQELMQTTANLIEETPAFDANAHDEQEAVTYKAPQEAEPDFTISRDDDGTWVLSGAKLERLFVMTNLDHEDSQLRFARQLRHMGVDDALREAGIQDGDLVRIEDFVFEFVQ